MISEYWVDFVGLQIHKLECGNIARVTCRTLSQTVFPRNSFGGACRIACRNGVQTGLPRTLVPVCQEPGPADGGPDALSRVFLPALQETRSDTAVPLRCRGCYSRSVRNQGLQMAVQLRRLECFPDPSGARIGDGSSAAPP